MAYIKEQATNFGISYNYWIIESFNVSYINGKGIVDIIFAGYISKEARENGAEKYTSINQQIPFEVFLTGFSKMTGFTDNDIKMALYSLKEYYTVFNDAVDEM